jgi:hypothetical protein
LGTIVAIALIALGTPAKSHAAGTDAEKEDILCNYAPKGNVEPLPGMVKDWVTVICLPSGQALAPEMASRGIWVARNGSTFVLDAAPRQWKRPGNLSKYDMRFTAFAAGERSGEALAKTLKMWDLAFAPEARPKIDRVVQLDAKSVWESTIYSLFFYVTESRPKWLIICKGPCNQAAAIKINYL